LICLCSAINERQIHGTEQRRIKALIEFFTYRQS